LCTPRRPLEPNSSLPATAEAAWAAAYFDIRDGLVEILDRFRDQPPVAAQSHQAIATLCSLRRFNSVKSLVESVIPNWRNCFDPNISA
jgi:hypothetical protein